MEVTVRCPECDGGLPVAAADPPEVITCARCRRQTQLSFSPVVRRDDGVDVCPVCAGGDFYCRKDFDPKTGVLVVAVGGLISAGFYWFDLDLAAYGVLAGAVLLDLVIARWLGDVTVCYRCHAEFRGAYPRSAPPFDLHTADALEPEYERRIGRR